MKFPALFPGGRQESRGPTHAGSSVSSTVAAETKTEVVLALEGGTTQWGQQPEPASRQGVRSLQTCGLLLEGNK